MSDINTRHCAVCGTMFGCGVGQSGASCWCAAFPPIMPADFSQDCRCPACLANAIDKRIQALIESHSITEMVELSRPWFNPDRLVEHVDYRIEHGKLVFSRWYHLKRGDCCGNGCRHCPYRP